MSSSTGPSDPTRPFARGGGRPVPLRSDLEPLRARHVALHGLHPRGDGWVQILAVGGADATRTAEQEAAPYAAARAAHGGGGVDWKAVAPIDRQGQAVMRRALEHPDQSDVGEGAGRREVADLPTDVAVAPRKPELFEPAVPARLAAPHHRVEGGTVLVHRQGVIAGADLRAECVV